MMMPSVITYNQLFFKLDSLESLYVAFDSHSFGNINLCDVMYLFMILEMSNFFETPSKTQQEFIERFNKFVPQLNPIDGYVYYKLLIAKIPNN